MNQYQGRYAPVTRPVSRRRPHRRLLHKRSRRMIKSLVRCLPTVLAIVIASVIGISTIVSLVHTEQHRFDSYAVETYTVKYGDTLWDIGHEFKGSELNIHDWISAVEELNGIDAMIYPGQEIKVYVSVCG